MQHHDVKFIESKRKHVVQPETLSTGFSMSVGLPSKLLKNRILFTLMGMGTLFPYNSLLTCVDYFADIHPEERDVAGQVAASTITALLVTTVMLIPASAAAAASPRNCASLFASDEVRIVLGFGFVCLLLIIFAFLDTPSMKTVNALSFLIGMADATSQSGLYVYAASFHHPSYTAAVSLGSAISGMAVSVLRLFTRALFSDEAKGASFLFSICSVFMVVCVSAFFYTNRQLRLLPNNGGTIELTNDFADEKYQNFPQNNGLHSALSQEDRPYFAEENGHSKNPLPVPAINIDENNDDIIPVSENRWFGEFNTFDSNKQNQQSCSENAFHDFQSQQNDDKVHQLQDQLDISSYRQICAIIWKPMVSIFITFFVTLSLFPGTIAAIQSSSSKTITNWMPVILITTFNVADCLGRVPFGSESWRFSRLLLNQNIMQTCDSFGKTYNFYELPNYNWMIWIPTWIRIVVFYPTIALCVLPSPENPVINSDVMHVLIVFVFGWTNGFIQCANFSATPTMILEHETKKRDASSLLLLLAAFLGLTCGAYFGLFVVNKILL